MDKTQTRKRQNSTTHISPDLRKAHSDIARGLNLENKNKEIILDYVLTYQGVKGQYYNSD